MDNNMIIGAIITVGLFVVTHGAATVWFASKVNTTLTFIQAELHKLADSLLRHDAEIYTNTEAAKDFAYRDQQIKAIWERLDAIK